MEERNVIQMNLDMLNGKQMTNTILETPCPHLTFRFVFVNLLTLLAYFCIYGA